jgi:hypothetical protein
MTAKGKPMPGNPYINRIFLECDFNRVGGEGNVLVVETNIKPGEKESHLDDVLMDLGQIQTLAQQRIGTFERIDIRFV